MLYKIKPLVWELAIITEPERWDADTGIFGTFHVYGDEGVFHWNWCIDEYYDEGQETCESIEDGKAKAEAAYRERLMVALEAVG